MYFAFNKNSIKTYKNTFMRPPSQSIPAPTHVWISHRMVSLHT